MVRGKGIKWNNEELKRLYWDEGMSLSQIGQRFNVDDTSVLSAMKHRGIPRRSISLSLSGELHPNWKGETYQYKDVSGYIRIRAVNHPKADHSGCIFEHRLVMEKHLGRHLQTWEIVHHLNGIKDDNRFENLIVLPRKTHDRLIKELQKRIRQLELALKAKLNQSKMEMV